jgi:hypothetical protein
MRRASQEQGRRPQPSASEAIRHDVRVVARFCILTNDGVSGRAAGAVRLMPHWVDPIAKQNRGIKGRRRRLGT